MKATKGFSSFLSFHPSSLTCLLLSVSFDSRLLLGQLSLLLSLDFSGVILHFLANLCVALLHGGQDPLDTSFDGWVLLHRARVNNLERLLLSEPFLNCEDIFFDERRRFTRWKVLFVGKDENRLVSHVLVFGKLSKCSGTLFSPGSVGRVNNVDVAMAVMVVVVETVVVFVVVGLVVVVMVVVLVLV